MVVRGLRSRVPICTCLSGRRRLPPPLAGQIPISSCRIIGLAHPEYVVTERREVKIYRRATPIRQDPSAIPGDTYQPTGFSFLARRQPVVQTRNPGFFVLASLGGEPGGGVFLEERHQLGGLDVFGIRVRARRNDSKDVLRSQDCQRIRQGRA